MSAIARADRVAVRCGACGEDQPNPFLTVRDYRIVRCAACGHVYVNPRPAPEALRSLYRDPRYFAGDGYLDYLSKEANYRRTFRALLDRLAGFAEAPRSGRFLDVGCAGGFLLDEARRRGWDVEGIEPSPSMARHARETLGLAIHEGSFEEAELDAGRFDLVCFADSLEHVEEPRAALAWAARRLRPHGALVVVTPNVESRLARLLGSRWPHYTPEEHIHYFSSRTLTQLAHASGFAPLHLGTIGHCWSADEILRRLPGARFAAAMPGVVQLGERGPLRRWLAHPVFLDVGDLLLIALRNDTVPRPPE